MYFEFIEQLKETCKEKGINLDKIGAVGGHEEYPFYQLTLRGSENPEVTICFSAGIHGNEIAGPWSAKAFIEQYSPEKYENLKIIIFPVANPSGYDLGKRRNFQNRDLNRHFRNQCLPKENQLLYNSIRKENIFFFHALHEDLDEYRFYLYHFGNEEETIHREIIILAENYFPINRSRQIYNAPARKGVIKDSFYDYSLEHRLRCEGVPFTICTETPGRRELSDRVKLNVDIMNLVAEFSSRQQLQKAVNETPDLIENKG